MCFDRRQSIPASRWPIYAGGIATENECVDHDVPPVTSCRHWVGRPAGLNHFRSWATQIKKRVDVPPPGKGDKKDRLHLAHFPSIEEAFAITFNESEFVAYPIEMAKIDKATRILNLHEAVAKPVELYVERVRRHIDNEERAVDVGLRVFVLPEIIFERCKPRSKRTGLPMQKGDFGRKQRQRSDVPLLNSIVDHDAEDFSTMRRIFTGRSKPHS